MHAVKHYLVANVIRYSVCLGQINLGKTHTTTSNKHNDRLIILFCNVWLRFASVNEHKQLGSFSQLGSFQQGGIV